MDVELSSLLLVWCVPVERSGGPETVLGPITDKLMLESSLHECMAALHYLKCSGVDCFEMRDTLYRCWLCVAVATVTPSGGECLSEVAVLHCTSCALPLLQSRTHAP